MVRFYHVEYTGDSVAVGHHYASSSHMHHFAYPEPSRAPYYFFRITARHTDRCGMGRMKDHCSRSYFVEVLQSIGAMAFMDIIHDLYLPKIPFVALRIILQYHYKVSCEKT